MANIVATRPEKAEGSIFKKIFRKSKEKSTASSNSTSPPTPSFSPKPLKKANTSLGLGSSSPISRQRSTSTRESGVFEVKTAASSVSVTSPEAVTPETVPSPEVLVPPTAVTPSAVAPRTRAQGNNSIETPNGTPPRQLPKVTDLHRSSSSAASFNLLRANSTGIAGPRATLTSKPSSGIAYNPYGLRTPSTSSSTSSFHGQAPPASFYISDSAKNLLALPVAHPNDILGAEFTQSSDDLLDTYALPDKGSSKDRSLGGGASSDVRTVLRRDSRKLFALKRFCKVLNETDDEFYERAAKEYVIGMKIAQGSHVVGLHGLFKFPTIGNLQRSWGMVLDLCDGGDLFSIILRPSFRVQTPLPEKFCLFKQIAYGVRFMHDQGIVHRDLKPENVLLSSQGIVKLTDFGVSDYGNEIPGDVTSPVKYYTQFVGSPPYSSPEVMCLQGITQARRIAYDPYQMDMWGLGMLLFCLIYQGTPFQESWKEDAQYREYLLSYTSYCQANPGFQKGDKHHGPGPEFKYAREFHSSGAARVAWRLCDPSAETRMDMTTLFDDPWFRGLEMCLEEDETEHAHALKPTTSSESLHSPVMTRANSNMSEIDVPHTPVRSMLDLSILDGERSRANSIHAPVSGPAQGLSSSPTNGQENVPASVQANASVPGTPTPKASTTLTVCTCTCDIHPLKESKRVKSMLDFDSSPEKSTSVATLSTLTEKDDAPARASSLRKSSDALSALPEEAACVTLAEGVVLESPVTMVEVHTSHECTCACHVRPAAIPHSRTSSFTSSAGKGAYKIKKHHHCTG